MFCNVCGEQVPDGAAFCQKCGTPVRNGGGTARVVTIRTRPGNGVAAVLSLFIPGAGQMYKGRVGGGIAWLIFTVLGYMAFVVPGLILHFICIFHAASVEPIER